MKWITVYGMRKVKYPSDRNQLEREYLAEFQNYDLQKLWVPLRDKLRGWSTHTEKDKLYPENVSDLLVARYDVLVKVYIDYQNIKQKHGNEPDFHKKETDLARLFHYSAEKGSTLPVFQPILAGFFMLHAEAMDLHVCHYCEMAYINTYKENSELDDFAHFLKTAKDMDVKRVITNEAGNPVGDRTVTSIMKLQKTYSEDTIVAEFDNLRCWRNTTPPKSEKLKRRLYRNQFDLDHFLPKSKCPLVGLSLYNFVPSCQVCNEKLKKDELLGNGDEGAMLKLSPTSDLYTFDTEMKVQITPTPMKLKVRNEKDKYHLTFMPASSVYQKEVEIFHLNTRYDYHRSEAFRLYDLMTDYPQARIKMLRNDFNGLKTEKEIEEDLFGMHHLKAQHCCFSKMLEDVYNQHRNEP